ncbi:MAG: hypothetical protein J2P48_15465 [Alphaproteobacteria bacterium]|nr:hypothetical protein [Alphaproteobacteria bacterium]
MLLDTMRARRQSRPQPHRPPGALADGSPGPRARTPGHAAFALTATKQPVKTSTATGKAFLDNLRRERQLEGISAAKARGVYRGCKLSIDAA